MDEIALFYDKWKEKVDLIEYQKISLPYELVEDKIESKIKKHTQPFNRLTINYKGDIFPCYSILYQDEYCLGNIENMTIYQTWHCKRMTDLRNRIITGKLMPHCNNYLLSIYGKKIK